MHALVRYQTTCASVVIAYGRDAAYLTRLGISCQAECYRHHAIGDPPQYRVMLRFEAGSGKGIAGAK